MKLTITPITTLLSAVLALLLTNVRMPSAA